VFLGYDWLIRFGPEELSRLRLHADLNKRDVLASKMIRQTVESACVDAIRAEIEVRLLNGIRLMSTSTFDEDPTWDVRLRMRQ
jgi:hypothetical protein